MKKLTLILTLLLIFTLGACSQQVAPPAPNELYAKIGETVDLSGVFTASAEYLEMNTGISAELYSEAVYAVCSNSNSPDEIAIILANNVESADKIEELLRERLSYIDECSMMYLTEYQPIIKDAIIRRDGLCVMLIVSPVSGEIDRAIDNLM